MKSQSPCGLPGQTGVLVQLYHSRFSFAKKKTLCSKMFSPKNVAEICVIITDKTSDYDLTEDTADNIIQSLYRYETPLKAIDSVRREESVRT